MKKIIIASLFAIVCLVGSAKAQYSYLVTQSTAIFLSSSTNLEILSVEISTGNGVDYALLIDSACTQFASGAFTNLSDRTSSAMFPVSQWATTQMVALTTATLQSPQKWSFEDSRGDGLRCKKGGGFLLLQSAVGNTVKIRYRLFR